MGRGAYGCVYLIKHKDGTPYASKEINLLGLNDSIQLAAIRETLLTRRLKHKNIIGFKDILYLKMKNNNKKGIILPLVLSYVLLIQNFII